MTTDRWPCKGAAHDSQHAAEQARHENQDGEAPRMVWRCAEGHLHEGELA